MEGDGRDGWRGMEGDGGDEGERLRKERNVINGGLPVCRDCDSTRRSAWSRTSLLMLLIGTLKKMCTFVSLQRSESTKYIEQC